MAAPVFQSIARKIYSDTPVVEEVDYAANLQDMDQEYEAYYKRANASHTNVPDVRNMAGMDAVSLLENMGYKVSIKGTGKVKNQSVKAGSPLKKGEIIKLELS